MMSSTTKNGVRIQTRGQENGTTAVLSPDVVKLLKTQDVGYIRAQIVAEKKRIRGLTERIAPSVAGLKEEWVEEREGRRETLQRAGLLVAPGKKGKQASNGGIVGAQGKKTVWLDDADALRAYKGSSASSSSSSGAMDTRAPP